jgi:hypothetical protein
MPKAAFVILASGESAETLAVIAQTLMGSGLRSSRQTWRSQTILRPSKLQGPARESISNSNVLIGHAEIWSAKIGEALQ